MTDWKAVFFDMDGVTVQSASVWREIEEAQILPAAMQSESLEENPIRGLSVADAYSALDAHADVELTLDRREFAQLFEDQAETVYEERAGLMTGYRELLEALREANLAIGLVSASGRSWVEMALERFDLLDAYDVIVTADDVEVSKPDPTGYLQAAEAVGVAPAASIVVEDSPHGIEAAKRAEMYCIALRGEGNPDLDLSHADTVVDGPEELRAEFRRLL